MKIAAVIAAIGLALLIYSQTWAFAWDEGFHLLAAQLIAKGRHPYVDFLFAQPPLNAYWNALLVRIFGATWRAPHAAAALETIAAVWLMADFVRSRMPERFAICTAVLIGCNSVVFSYGTIAQPYAMSMLLGAAAFRLIVATQSFASGLASGAAASSSLLTAPFGPLLLIWLARQTRSFRNASAFVAGYIAGFGPVIFVLLKWPHQAWFDLVRFHLHYRQVAWRHWPAHDLGVVTAWLTSPSGFVLVALAVAGLTSLRRASREVQLCGLLTVVLAPFLAAGHPTFAQYFSLVVPFAAVLAVSAIQRLGHRGAQIAITIAIGVTIADLARAMLWDAPDEMQWSDLTELVQTVDRVTPPGAPISADEHIYFLTNRMPPSGLEWTSGHKVEVPLDQARPLHLVPQSELDRQTRNGDFATVETCYEGEIARLGLRRIYSEEKQIDDCFVFWHQRAKTSR